MQSVVRSLTLYEVTMWERDRKEGGKRSKGNKRRKEKKRKKKKAESGTEVWREGEQNKIYENINK